MIKIDSLFSRFKKILESGNAARELVSETIFSVTNIKIGTEKIQIKNGEIIIDETAGAKSRIFIAKQKILAILGEKAPGKFKNIR